MYRDPYFADAGTLPAIWNTPRGQLRNPLVPLPLPVSELTAVDAVIITHLHPDHYDEAASKAIPKDMPLYVQSIADAAAVRKHGFQRVHVLGEEPTRIGEVTMVKTGGQHGTGSIGRLMGSVCGVVLSHPEEPVLYIAGDTIWCAEVEQAIQAHRPEIIVVNGGEAQFRCGRPITMGMEDIWRMHEAAPEADIVVVHMEALNHCLLTRTELSEAVRKGELESKIQIPADGQRMLWAKSPVTP